MNWILCGMMGSGKTTVGRELAKALSYSFVDTDEVIVNRYGNISEIFAQKGESYFRGLEREIVGELATKDRLVISTGGGLVLNEDNVTLLKEKGSIIYLRAKKETLLVRLQGDNSRPLLEGQSLEEKLTELLSFRESIYQGVADNIIDVDGKTVGQIVKEITAK